MGVAERPVSDVMQTEVVSLGSGDRLDLADDIMRLGRIRHMPVLDASRVVGVVSSRDLLAASLSKILDFAPEQRRSFMRSVDVGDVMTRDLVTVTPETTLREAARLMVQNQIGCLPVVSPDGTFVGLVTETDLIRSALLWEEPGAEPELGVEQPATRTDPSEPMHEELESLRRARDELRLQIHLAKADAKDLWEQVERKYHEAESRLKVLSREAEEPVHEMADALKLLLEEVREGYRRVRRAL
jgi:CBS domain-containing protein